MLDNLDNQVSQPLHALFHNKHANDALLELQDNQESKDLPDSQDNLDDQDHPERVRNLLHKSIFKLIYLQAPALDLPDHLDLKDLLDHQESMEALDNQVNLAKMLSASES